MSQALSRAILTPEHPARRAAEDLVRSVYRKQYGATIRTFPALMVGLVDETGTPACVAGVRLGLADCFSEVYLDAPLEQVLSAAAGKTVAREQILEVGGLASVRPGASFRLLREIIDHGRDHGMRWGVFTATGSLRRLIRATCLPMVELGPATADRIPNPEDWGTYYKTRPVVCAVPDTILPPLADVGAKIGDRLRWGESAEPETATCPA